MARLTLENNPLTALGRWALDPILEMGRMTTFFFLGLGHVFSYPWQPRKILDRCTSSGPRASS